MTRTDAERVADGREGAVVPRGIGHLRIGVRPGERTALVTRGPFRWMRNPFFTGMALVAAGTTASSPTYVGAVATAILFATLVVQVRAVEEPHLVRVFGADYLAYARSTGRFIPWVGRLA